jgi:hypothetical protein
MDKGHKKDIISYGIDKKALKRESGFDKQSNGDNGMQVDFSVFLNKKTEKLTTALYMVTSFLSDNEPLKWKLRKRGIDLLSDITTVRNNSVSEVENIFAEYVFSVEDIVSLLEVSVASKLISEMNFSILKKEYISLKVLIESEEYAEKRSGKFVFPPNFFLEDDALDQYINKPKLTTTDTAQEINKGHYGHKRQVKSLNIYDGVHEVTQGQKSSPNTKYSVKDKERVVKNIKEGKINRRNAILRLFKKNKELTIKDISFKVSGCSEKTIQRELLALVAERVLNKKGERRWSKYYLK